MSWSDFDALCAAQNEQLQLSLENAAMAGITAAVAAGSGLREAIAFAIPQIMQENNWLTLVEILQEKPMALPPESDGQFYNKCPKPALEIFVAGEKGVFSHLLDRLNSPESKDHNLDAGHIRLMHTVIDSLVALGQTERLKRVADMFKSICETRCEDGRIPGSVYHKLVEKGVIQKSHPSSGNGNSHNGNGSTANRPPRKLAKEGGDMGGNPSKPANEPEEKRVDHRPAKPPKGNELPDNSMAAQLAAVATAGSVQ